MLTNLGTLANGKERMMSGTEFLGQKGADAAMRAAVEWFQTHPETIYDTEALLSCIRANCRIRMPEAFDDMRQAVEAGMYQAGLTTFCATMALAGIDGAKEAARV